MLGEDWLDDWRSGPKSQLGRTRSGNSDVAVEEESHTEIISHHIPKVKIFIHFLDV